MMGVNPIRHDVRFLLQVACLMNQIIIENCLWIYAEPDDLGGMGERRVKASTVNK